MTKSLPNLMPYQMEPFNGDKFICEKFIQLRDKFNIKAAIETGTCLGSTTLWLAKNFKRVDTVESSQEYLNIAQERFDLLEGKSIIRSWHGDSAKLLPVILNHVSREAESVLLFLDAHWGDVCPLKEELTVISESKIKPVIAIHDFKVPGRNFGFDTYRGQEFTYDWLKPYFEKIYGKNFDHEYNYEVTEKSAQRGIIYLTPVK